MFRQVILVALVSVAMSVLCTFVLLRVFFPNGEGTVMALTIATIVPLLVALPTTYYVSAQREKVKLLHDDLSAAHEELKSLHEQAEHRASIDFMTGLLNRESFLTKTKFRRRKTDAGYLLMIDVDYFKQINDTHGHQTGDEALLAIVSVMKKQIRDTDILGRIGGEEFALFLSDMGPERAWDMAEAIRRNVERIVFTPSDNVVHPLTVSIGIAPAPGKERMYEIMNHADHSLYGAKHSGRNRVAFRHRKKDKRAEDVIQAPLTRAS
jgi:diguanylate cyclase (GGDEF)-like protein